MKSRATLSILGDLSYNSLMKKLTLTVVRHGETPSNLTGVVTGRSEDSLTINGKNQMVKVRENLKGKTFLSVYASPMKRCIESVQIVAPEYDPIYDDRLAERDLGELKNYTIDQLWEKPLWNSLETAHMDGGAETLLSGLERVKSFLNDLKEQYPEGGELLLVTHSFISRCLWIVLEDIKDPDEMSTFLHPNDEIKQYILTF